MEDESQLAKLLSISGPALGGAVRSDLAECLLGLGERGVELLEVLRAKNGFLAFESALQVYPLDPTSDFDVLRWNANHLWKEGYGDVFQGLFFFGQDIFGMQFGFKDGKVKSFDTESGSEETIAEDLEKWAELILSDYDVRTGYPLAHEWQVKNGPLALGQRLAPKVPFVLGGEYHIDNLYSTDMVSLLGFRADLFTKIADVPDGTRVRLSVGSDDNNFQ